jgi:hypothetical protein
LRVVSGSLAVPRAPQRADKDMRNEVKAVG